MHLPDVAPTKPGFLIHLRQAVYEHRLLAGMVLVYAAISLTLSTTIADRVEAHKFGGLWRSFTFMLPMMAYFVLMWRFMVARFTVAADQRMAWLKADLVGAVTDPRRIASAAIGICLMFVVLVSFAQLKRLIPIIQPFSWDVAMMEVDRALHFGIDPWKIAHAIAGNYYVMTVFSGAYNFWLFIMYFSLIFACFSTANKAARMQYLIAFILTWAIGGNLVATIFSSAGPVYWERLGIGDHYAPLMAILRDHALVQPISVTVPQDLLWAMYSGPESLSGISAFPSMHVASTTLMMLYTRAYNRRFGQFMLVFTGVILIGSVLSAWHYAVDGYAGILIALGCWWLAGRVVGKTAAASV